jgi:hypothetical protein
VRCALSEVQENRIWIDRRSFPPLLLGAKSEDGEVQVRSRRTSAVNSVVLPRQPIQTTPTGLFGPGMLAFACFGLASQKSAGL